MPIPAILSLSLGALYPKPAITSDGKIVNPAAAVVALAKKERRVISLFSFIFMYLISVEATFACKLEKISGFTYSLFFRVGI
jgi:hypothetical protein